MGWGEKASHFPKVLAWEAVFLQAEHETLQGTFPRKMCSTMMDFRSCSLQADGEGVLITVPHPTSMEQEEHIQHFLLHPQMYWDLSKGVGFAYQEALCWSHLQWVHSPSQGQYGWEAFFSLRDKHPLRQIFPDPVGREWGHRRQKCRDAAQCCLVPCNSLWTQGSIMPSTYSTQ